ncbi:orotidine-5'-phosphate decarboxylase [Fodinibius salinus]|uniref:Orotidine-5'-phosphate decarboxylase n=1 Tax=Fodinibius salinus TaxID=860790 RepID=A0A5D3YF99_9BACT|nr:orotidine-5'-phosphate decarboxylase [Fodinibius salinus]TYP91683.1 orotidine-5'-phosphate decarboxylase [Fodinibius salinus]
MNFKSKLGKAIGQAKSTLCVGLDPNLDLLPNAITDKEIPPAQQVEQFLKTVIDVTTEHCAAYKPNLGFFEALGSEGWTTFGKVLSHIPNDKIVIADAKRGDISSTAEHYAKAFWNRKKIDALTLNPLMGFETLDPFLKESSKGIYVLALTSNPGAKDILLRKLSSGQTVSEVIANQLKEKQRKSDTSIGMVVGATKAEQLTPVISSFPEAPLLIPGVGKQGGSINALANTLENHNGLPLINSSRSIIYAGNDTANWQQDVAASAENLKNKLAPITQRYV